MRSGVGFGAGWDCSSGVATRVAAAACCLPVLHMLVRCLVFGWLSRSLAPVPLSTPVSAQQDGPSKPPAVCLERWRWGGALLWLGSRPALAGSSSGACFLEASHDGGRRRTVQKRKGKESEEKTPREKTSRGFCFGGWWNGSASAGP